MPNSPSLHRACCMHLRHGRARLHRRRRAAPPLGPTSGGTWPAGGLGRPGSCTSPMAILYIIKSPFHHCVASGGFGRCDLTTLLSGLVRANQRWDFFAGLCDVGKERTGRGEHAAEEIASTWQLALLWRRVTTACVRGISWPRPGVPAYRAPRS